MPEDPAQDASEAVETAVEATERNRSASPWKRISQLTNFVASVTALLVAAAAFMKTCDHSVTERAYAAATEGIQQNQKAVERQQKELLALREYVAPPVQETPQNDMGISADGGILFVPTIAADGFVAARDAFLDAAPDAGTVIKVKPVIVVEARKPPPPPVSSAPVAWKPKAWDSIKTGL